jgi:hypothetical protein
LNPRSLEQLLQSSGILDEEAILTRDYSVNLGGNDVDLVIKEVCLTLGRKLLCSLVKSALLQIDVTLDLVTGPLDKLIRLGTRKVFHGLRALS